MWPWPVNLKLIVNPVGMIVKSISNYLAAAGVFPAVPKYAILNAVPQQLGALGTCLRRYKLMLFFAAWPAALVLGMYGLHLVCLLYCVNKAMDLADIVYTGTCGGAAAIMASSGMTGFNDYSCMAVAPAG